MLVVGASDQASNLRFPGRVRAAQRADLAFNVAGQVIELPAEEGQLQPLTRYPVVRWRPGQSRPGLAGNPALPRQSGQRLHQRTGQSRPPPAGLRP